MHIYTFPCRTLVWFHCCFKLLYHNRILAYATIVWSVILLNIMTLDLTVVIYTLWPFLLHRGHRNVYLHYKKIVILKKVFLVFIRNRLKSGELEPVLRHTKKLCLASYYIKFSTNLKMYNYKIKNLKPLLSPCLRHVVVIEHFTSAESCL